MNMINFLAKPTGKECVIEGLDGIFYYATVVVRVIQIAAPIALIIGGSIDLLKAVIAGDAKKINEARKPFLQRLISAVIIFLIPWIVDLALNNFADTGNEWAKCYSAAKNAQTSSVNPDPGSY